MSIASIVGGLFLQRLDMLAVSVFAVMQFQCRYMIKIFAFRTLNLKGPFHPEELGERILAAATSEGRTAEESLTAAEIDMLFGHLDAFVRNSAQARID